MTSLKDAIKAWEADSGLVAAEAEDVRLCPIALQLPLISKLDGTLGSLKKCKHLRLSTNAIDKMGNFSGLDNLQILSMGRNQIKKLEGLEPIADTLEQLWLSYNSISSLAGIEKLSNLQVLFIAQNKIDKWSEVERLAALPKLRDLLLTGNPLAVKASEEGNWRIEVLKRLPNLKTLDGQLVEDDEREAAKGES
mmetsp:Transcript_29226/g.64037  ORF Transcript_29226/g.64037 Transcript_29226/m.64037 type:complete len:194 (-) Transcript_29226:417-998(-)